MNENAAQQATKKRFPITNVLLGILIVAVIWLGGMVGYITDTGSVYIQNSDSGYSLLKTNYGPFPVSISKTKAVKDGTELTLTIINPLVIYFKEANVVIEAYGTTESKLVDLAPSANEVKFNVAPLNRGDEIKVSMELNRIYFK